jgi:hypothetical protein
MSVSININYFPLIFQEDDPDQPPENADNATGTETGASAKPTGNRDSFEEDRPSMEPGRTRGTEEKEKRTEADHDGGRNPTPLAEQCTRESKMGEGIYFLFLMAGPSANLIYRTMPCSPADDELAEATKTFLRAQRILHAPPPKSARKAPCGNAFTWLRQRLASGRTSAAEPAIAGEANQFKPPSAYDPLDDPHLPADVMDAAARAQHIRRWETLSLASLPVFNFYLISL